MKMAKMSARMATLFPNGLVNPVHGLRSSLYSSGSAVHPSLSSFMGPWEQQLSGTFRPSPFR